MQPKRPLLAKPLPGWVVVLVSLFVVFHFLALGAHVLSARTGPWLVPSMGIPSMAEPPAFAALVDQRTREYYLRPLGLIGDYTYASDRGDMPEVYIEARLRNEQGDLIKTIRLPDKTDNAWLRQRHALLALGLGGDMPVPVQQMVQIPAPGQQSPKIKLWQPAGPMEKKLVLHETEQHLVKGLMKDPTMQLSRPREWTLLLARAYARYLCGQVKAASVELVRFHRDALSPVLLVLPGDQIPPGTFDTFESQFEVYTREN
jgi:hypothetical protein